MDTALRFLSALKLPKRPTILLLSMEANAGRAGCHDCEWAMNVLAFFAYHLGVVGQLLLYRRTAAD